MAFMVGRPVPVDPCPICGAPRWESKEGRIQMWECDRGHWRALDVPGDGGPVLVATDDFPYFMPVGGST